MKEAITKAIDGGFNTHKGYKFSSVRWIGGVSGTVIDLVDSHESGNSYVCVSAEELWLNPLFWQALGKALNWPDELSYPEGRPETVSGWLYFWHRFIDHLASGKPAEDFFTALLTTHKE